MASPTFDTNAGSVQHVQTGFATTATLPGLTTNQSPDTIVVVAFYEVYAGGPFSVSSVTSTHLTFTKRSSVINTTSGAHDMGIDVWEAPSSGTLASEVITVNWTGTGTLDGICVAAFALTGLYSTATPFDTNVALPATAFNTTATVPPTMSITTSQAHDLLFYFAGDSAGHILDGGLAPTGWTSLFSGTELHNASYINYCYGCIAYLSVSSTQSATSVVSTQTANDVSYVSDVDALTADNPSPGSVASASGVGAASGVALTGLVSVASAAGSGTASAVSGTGQLAAGTAAGAGVASGVAIGILYSIGSASGAGNASGVAKAGLLSVGTATGAGFAFGTGVEDEPIIGAAAGRGQAYGVGVMLGRTLPFNIDRAWAIDINGSVIDAVQYDPITDVLRVIYVPPLTIDIGNMPMSITNTIGSSPDPQAYVLGLVASAAN